MGRKKKEERREEGQGKFTPVQLIDQTDDQKELTNLANEQWNNHIFVNNHHPYWREWIAWWEGDQYKVVNPADNELTDVTPMVERETKNVYNRVMPLVRQVWGELRYEHEFFVIPNTTEFEDVKASKAGSLVIEFTNEKGMFNTKLNRAKLWAIITGAAYWKEWWNKDLRSQTEGEGEASGDVDYDYVNPFNVRPDPLAANPEGWRWFIEGKRLPQAAVEKEFKLEAGSLEAVAYTADESNLFERTGRDHPTEPTVIRMEYWERPSEKHPKGRFAVICGNWLLYDGDNPSPGYKIPYFQIPGIVPLLGEQIYDSIVRIVQAPQRQFNRLCSLVDEHIENFKIKGMIPWGSLKKGELQKFTSGNVDYVIYNPRLGGTPHYQTPPAMPETVISWLNFQENELQMQPSVREVSYARLPQYSSRASGVLFEGLKKQDEAVVLPMVEDIDKVCQEIMRFRLELVKQHYDEKRLVKTVGKNKEISINYFSKADIGSNTDVRVKSGVDIFTTRRKKHEVVMAMIEKGMIEDPRKALELLDVKNMDEFMEDEFIDERQAWRHLEIMKKGATYIEPDQRDAHDIHIKIFNNFRKSEEFETLGKKAKENIIKRIEKHEELMNAEGEGEEIAEETAPPVEGEIPVIPGEIPPIPGEIPPEMGIPPGMGAQPQLPEGMTPEMIMAILQNLGYGG